MTRTRHKLFAVAMVVAMVMMAFAPAAAAASAQTGNDDGNTSTDDGGNTAVDDGDENETDDEPLLNGTNASDVARNQTSEIDGNETDGNESDAFGLEVSSFVSGLLGDDANATNDTNATAGPGNGIGQLVAQFVLANNPGNAPDHAGPPADAGPGNNTNVSTGPPEDAGGPPSDAGPDGNETDSGGGPPSADSDGDDGGSGGGSGGGNGGGQAKGR